MGIIQKNGKGETLWKLIKWGCKYSPEPPVPTFSNVVDKANRSAALSSCKNVLTSVLADQKDAALGVAYFEYNGYWFQYDGSTFTALDAKPSITVYQAKADAVYAADDTATNTAGHYYKDGEVYKECPAGTAPATTYSQTSPAKVEAGYKSNTGSYVAKVSAYILFSDVAQHDNTKVTWSPVTK